MHRIGIMGTANSGKNTLSRILIKQLRDKHGEFLSANYLAFADPIKEMVRQMFPNIPRKHLYGSSKYRGEIIPGAFKDETPLTVRQLLMDLGTEGRKYDPDIWIKNFAHRFNSDRFRHNSSYRATIAVDVRFRNEFDYLRDNGFYLIRLYRNTQQPIIQHISETGQQAILDKEFDCVLYNDKSLQTLKEKVANSIIPNVISI